MKKEPTKKAPAKKAPAKKAPAKKAPTKKAPAKKAKVTLLEFSMTAVIPTMSYGNIQPTISVKAKTLEEANEFVLPYIEELYKTYAYSENKTSYPRFMKEKVTVTEKVVDVKKKEQAKEVKVPVKTEVAETVKETEKVSTPEVKKEVLQVPSKPSEGDSLSASLEESRSFTKASKAIASAMSIDAVDQLQAQIHRSKNLTEPEKPLLLEECLLKRKELKTA